MPLIEINKPSDRFPFDKHKIAQAVITLIREEFPAWKVISSKDEDDGYDLLLIRNLTIQRMIRINSLNPFEKEEEQIIQQVVAISFVDPLEELNKEVFKTTEGWTKSHLIISDITSLRRRLKYDSI